MENIVFLLGTFDPVHNGHLRLAHAASLKLNADVVFVLLPSANGKKGGAKSADRLAMLKLALDENGSAAFSIDKNFMNSAKAKTIDVVSALSEKYAKYHRYLLLGSDEARAYEKKEEAERISDLCTILIADRPGYNVPAEIVDRYWMEHLDYDGAGAVSSSDIRTLKSMDIPIRVMNYIEKQGLYYMKKLSELLTPHRYVHSISVANLAYKIARSNYAINPKNAYIAGLIHDIGKDVPIDKSSEIMQRDFPEYADYPAFAHHQFVGVTMAKEIFGIEDGAILDAIEFHCTGRPHMSSLGKIIYSADKIEPGRGYNSRRLIRACERNYYVGFIKVLKENEKFLAEKGKGTATPLSEACHLLYLGRDKDKGEKK